MGLHVASSVVKLLNQNGNLIKGTRALVLGITFKENCPDIRNSRVIDVIKELMAFGIEVDVYDPQADKKEVEAEYGIQLKENPEGKYSAIVLAVSHDDFKELDFTSLKNEHGIIYDIKSFLPREIVDGRL